MKKLYSDKKLNEQTHRDLSFITLYITKKSI